MLDLAHSANGKLRATAPLIGQGKDAEVSAEVDSTQRGDEPRSLLVQSRGDVQHVGSDPFHIGAARDDVQFRSAGMRRCTRAHEKVMREQLKGDPLPVHPSKLRSRRVAKENSGRHHGDHDEGASGTTQAAAHRYPLRL
jgi:hypothetical protein